MLEVNSPKESSLIGVVEDEKYPGMYRIKWPDGEVSDMVNKTRANEAIRLEKEYQRKIKTRRVSGDL